MTDAVVIKAAVGGIKTHPLGSRSSQAHTPAVLMRFPCTSSFLQTGQQIQRKFSMTLKNIVKAAVQLVGGMKINSVI